MPIFPLRNRRTLDADDREAGYSLVEVMVVLIIIGILALLAIPRLMGVVSRAKMAEAKVELGQVHALQQAYYYEHDAYASELADIGYVTNPTVDEGGTARYVVSVERTDGGAYTAVARSVVDFDRDGTFNEWSVDETGRVEQRVED